MEKFVGDAVTAVSGVPFPTVLAEAYVADAHVRRAAGDSDRAQAALEQGRDAYAGKGMVLQAPDAERQLAELSSPTG